MKLKNKVNDLDLMLQSLESQHHIHRNETSEKGMSLMDQISELKGSISDLDDKQNDQGRTTDKIFLQSQKNLLGRSAHT